MKKAAIVLAMAGMVAAFARGAATEWEHVGRIVTSDGLALTGDATLEVRLFDRAEGGEALWGRKAPVHLDGEGNYSVRLGDGLAALPEGGTNTLEAVLAAGPVWVEAKVEGRPGAMSPRAVAAVTPYALFAAGATESAGDFDAAGTLTVVGATTVATFRARSAKAEGALDVADTLKIDGDLTVACGMTEETQEKTGVVPVGTVVLFYGTDVPDGWALCDGKNGTPDLRGLFVVGAGGDYQPGDKGGADEVDLREDELPAHHHTYGVPTFMARERDWQEGSGPPAFCGWGWAVWESGDVHANDISRGHENNPPFLALDYIMRVE